MSSSLFPNQIDSFTIQTDISNSDIPTVQQYQALLTSTSPLNPTQQAQLTSLTQQLQSAGKLLSADFLNSLANAIVSTESYFLNTVNSDITNMENTFAAKVAKFSNQGTYNPATNYMDMNFVTWNNQSYICTLDNTINIDPSHTSNWVLIAAQGATGPTGPAGASLSYIGTYSSLSTYQQNQLVSYNGSTYICTQNNVTGQTPTNTTYWTEFVTGATPLAQSTAPTSPVVNQLWINTTTGVMEYWNGTSWMNIESSGMNDGTINVTPSQFGTIGSLTTTTKTDLVSAINEVKSEANTNQTNIGTLSSLTTTAKSNLVAAINEVKGEAGVTSVNGSTGAVTVQGFNPLTNPSAWIG